MAGLKIWYDREGDYLEVVFEDAPASMEEIDDDLFERRTRDGRIVGFAVLNFSKHDRDKLTMPLSVTAVEAAN
ncbi:MAG: DUF2283 domain-containing protein [Chloroflexota bacterium]|nr:DUF2283 domain-containing protein [Chloroflexota bacterium]